MADRARDAGQAPPWRGFHHVALVTPDLDATIRFYGEVLGMTVLADIPASERGGRHCLLAVDGDAGSFLHFFERADARIHPYPLAEGLVFPPSWARCTTSRSPCPTRRRGSRSGRGWWTRGCR